MKWLPEPRILLPAAVMAGGLVLAAGIIATGPRVQPRPPAIPAPLVRVIEAQPESVRLRVTTHGTVVPRTESELVPEVAGPVTWVSPALVSGGFFEADEPLLRIDPRDYRVALERARAALDRAESEHSRASRDLERRRGLADRDFASAAQLDTAVNTSNIARANLRDSRAALERAERDLERTEIRAPYRGRVREESVDVGQFVSRGQRIARLYAVDYAEVRLPIPDRELAYLDLPLLYRDASRSPGSEVILSAHFGGREQRWEGRVVRTEGEIDPQTRMVNVVARVADPYGSSGDRAPLSVGLFVEAEILGRSEQNVFVLPRSALRDGDRMLVVDDGMQLRFREVEVLQVSGDQVILRAGLTAGERVCASPLEAPVDGMRVRLEQGAEVPS
ncbi:MAG: efflux RND transporter periplasmic adaptor subunit [Proteobacteria bacterium]|nr:efflux RND transporter periplasmic adaptor subunit [Pseudomonadota bacterium]